MAPGVVSETIGLNELLLVLPDLLLVIVRMLPLVAMKLTRLDCSMHLHVRYAADLTLRPPPRLQIKMRSHDTVRYAAVCCAPVHLSAAPASVQACICLCLGR